MPAPSCAPLAPLLPVLVFLLLLPSSLSLCVAPRGISDAHPLSHPSSSLYLPDGITRSYFSILAPLVFGAETPAQFHQIFIGSLILYSAQAPFDDAALDPWARADVSDRRRRCREGVHNFELHQRVTFAYAMVNMARVVPAFRQGTEQVYELARSHGLDPLRCTRGGEGCEGKGATDTPWGLTWVIGQEVLAWMEEDGFNAEGNVDRNFNRRPYSDWRDVPYVPARAPWLVGTEGDGLERWSPLVEAKKGGLSFWQMHVTPHIGETGKSFYAGDHVICGRSLQSPRYDLREELRAVVRRSARLDEMKKAEVEFFDNKVGSLVPLQQQFFGRLGVDLDKFEYWKWNFAANAALYEGILAVWRVKVETDLVRPTTVAEVLGKGWVKRAWGGSGKGVGPVKVDEWEPYIRTMPHAEFPSASSCLCTVFAEVHNSFLTTRGNDTEFAKSLGGPLVFDVLAGSSSVEKGLPGKNITLSYDTWDEVASRCSESRLNGGMHFRAAVPAGVELCTGLGKITIQAVMDIVGGKRPAYVAAFDSPRPPQSRCGRGSAE